MAHQRSSVVFRGDRVLKTFVCLEAASREHFFYTNYAWAAPRVLGFDGLVLSIERLPLVVDDRSWKPVKEMMELLLTLFEEGVHHRDVHAGNLVRGPDGPLLIDWETAVLFDGAPVSYDLAGPTLSGVPKPAEHANCGAQWWGSGSTELALERWWA